MTLANKIKSLRQKENLTQEAFAEKIMVSRQAVTKWEAGKGVPDIENLKTIANVFGISIDALLNEKCGIDNAISAYENSVANNSYPCITNNDDFIGTICSIELSGWNDGAYDVTLLSKDDNFLYYIYTTKKETILGAIAQRFIKSITNSNIKGKFPIDCSAYYGIDETFFVGKAININLRERYIWDGVIGKETELNDVILKSVLSTEYKVMIGKVVEQAIPKDEIAKFEYTVNQ